jgi:aminomethyltransferase
MTALLRTPLTATHERLGARLVEFAGFSMPVQYTSIKEEHAAVRERAGVFDVSHMGQLRLSGPEAIATAERLLSCPVASLRVGRIRYALLCNDAGGVVDDVMVYRTAKDAIFLCVNAANIEKDRAWILAHAGGATVTDESDTTGLLALQGPNAVEILGRLAEQPVTDLKRFNFRDIRLAGRGAMVSNTGYTGSPGFEIYLASSDTETVFTALLDAGQDLGLVPTGLGARDTLRLEAALPLYGHELDDETSPLQAGLDRFLKRDVGGFIGAEAIEERAKRGEDPVLVGFELESRGVARADHAIMQDSRAIGRVTSGGPSPTLGRSIGLAYVPLELSSRGTSLSIDVRGRSLEARVVETPFVRGRP